MTKAAAAMAVVFMVGGGAVTVLGSLFGSHAEAATLAIMGVAMVGSGQMLGAPRRQQKLVPKPSEAQ